MQGVGFRPGVYRLAVSLGLTGYVQNRRSEVVAEVQGDEDKAARFAAELVAALPPAARVETMTESASVVQTDDAEFRIIESAADAYAFPPIPPDLPLCADCARELLARENRRFLYPFITCTQCGPRYSIVERTPFDRANTTMLPFAPCPECAAEYAGPSDRRFHSQTNSCARCGPALVCCDRGGNLLPGDPIAAAVAALRQGKVAAIQGIGGFHLAADPRAAGAMKRLRREKERERKPFALMVRDLEEAHALCELSKVEEELLSSPEAPILIAPRRASAPSWTARVSDTDTLGVMLPYTPLHLLLFRHPLLDIPWRALVMTSGNRADEPIITDPGEARRKLAGAADVFLSHDRRIAFRTDDSVLRAGPSAPPVLLRRSRGYVPRLIPLSRDVRGVILALGGDLKSSPALARGKDLHLCAYNGDLESPESLEQFERQIDQVLHLYDAAPDMVVHDMHPLYHSAAWPVPTGARRVTVQHHFAHALSVMAEHGLDETLALSFDGTGYGTDGGIWGGEFLHTTRAGFTRLGSFAPFPLPGGDAAVLHPPRIAFALVGDRARGMVPGLDAPTEAFLHAMIGANVNCPVTTSLGRVFDAASALLGLVAQTSYEGEGPIRLEGRGLSARARSPAVMGEREALDLVRFEPGPGDERLFLLDPRPLLLSLLGGRTGGRADERAGASAPERVPEQALRFHEAIALASVEGARRMRRHTGISRIALSGGVFQNILFRELLVPHLNKDGFEVFLNVRAPAGDGGLAVGQAWFEER